MPLAGRCLKDLVNSQRGSTKDSLKIIMDLGGREGADIPMAISSNFSPIHEGGAPKLKLLTGTANGGSNGLQVENLRQNSEVKVKKAIRYRECQKNHAANLGGYAFDGCGEFMPSGEEGTLEALKCAACECHRNFHRREVEGEPSCDCRQDRKRPLPSIMTPQTPLPLPPGAMVPKPPSQMIMALNTLPSESDDQEGGFLSPLMAKKRFRTKFTFEQKEKMLSFAEKVGWRLRKHDDASVQQFCYDVGVKRQVLKVWMHNNKNTLGKKLGNDFVLAPDATNVDEENTS